MQRRRQLLEYRVSLYLSFSLSLSNIQIVSSSLVSSMNMFARSVGNPLVPRAETLISLVMESSWHSVGTKRTFMRYKLYITEYPDSHLYSWDREIGAGPDP